jgi:hypothetical protein
MGTSSTGPHRLRRSLMYFCNVSQSGYQLDISDGLNYHAALTGFADGLYRARLALSLVTRERGGVGGGGE